MHTKTPAQILHLEALHPTIDALRALAALMEAGVVQEDLDDPNDEVNVIHGWQERGWQPCNEHTARLIDGMQGNGPGAVKIEEWHEFDCPTNRDFVGRLLSMRVRVCTRADDPVSQAAADRIRSGRR